MVVSLATLKKTAPERHPLTVIYGPEKVGKTKLASEFPNPIFMKTAGENAPAGVDADSWEIEKLDDFFDGVGVLITDEHDFKTLVIDAADGLDRMAVTAACERNGWQSIEEPGFGKGYVEVESIWANEIIAALKDLRAARDMNIVLICHVDIFKFEDPANGNYSRFQPNLGKKALPLVLAAADVIAFVNHRVSIVKEDKGFNQKTTRAEGAGQRVMYLEGRPSYIAGNRYKMPREITFAEGKGFSELAKYLPKDAA